MFYPYGINIGLPGFGFGSRASDPIAGLIDVYRMQPTKDGVTPFNIFSDPAATSPVVDQGATIQTIKDSTSGSGIIVSQATLGKRPTLDLSAGIVEIKFDGVNDELRFPSNLTLPTNFDIFVVGRRAINAKYIPLCHIEGDAQAGPRLWENDHMYIIGDNSANVVEIPYAGAYGLVGFRWTKAGTAITMEAKGMAPVAAGTLSDTITINTIGNVLENYLVGSLCFIGVTSKLGNGDKIKGFANSLWGSVYDL